MSASRYTGAGRVPRRAFVCSLMALAIGATGEGQAKALGRGVRAARLQTDGGARPPDFVVLPLHTVDAAPTNS